MSKATIDSAGSTVASVSEQTSSASRTPIISNDLPPDLGDAVIEIFADSENIESFPQNYNRNDFYSDIVRQTLKADLVHRGRVSCHFFVHPAVANYYNGLHGGAVAAIAERVAIACARTVITEDKELFLGELGTSYLSAARINEDLVISGSVVRSGRNLTVVSVEFKNKKTGKLVYTSRATFYHMPFAKL